MGRPTKPDEERCSASITLFLTERQKEILSQEAKKHKMDLSRYIRWLLFPED